MPSGVYPRKPGTKRGPYHRKKPKAAKPRKLKAKKHSLEIEGAAAPAYLCRGIAEAFDWFRERGLDLLLTLPPEMQARLDAIRAKRKKEQEAWTPLSDD